MARRKAPAASPPRSHASSRVSSPRLVSSPDQATRTAAAGDWLQSQPADTEVLVVGPTWDACDDLARNVFRAAGARFGTTRLTLDHLAARLAALSLASEGRAPAAGLLLTAASARAIHTLERKKRLEYFAPVAARPRFPVAIAHTLSELRMNAVPPKALRKLPAGGKDLAALLEAFEAELGRAKLADRAVIFDAALAAAEGDTPAPFLSLPLLLLDLPIAHFKEAALVSTLARRSRDVLATAAAGDDRSIDLLEQALGVSCGRLDSGDSEPRRSSLAMLKTHLFEESTAPTASLDPTVTFRSWPGEARECVEIARSVQHEAARGVTFDRMAIFLRSPEEYAPHLEEAFRRASIPLFFSRGSSRPDPAGRALLTLLACRAERLSARRFAEYVSLAQVPDPDFRRDEDAAFVPPIQDLLPVSFAEADGAGAVEEDAAVAKDLQSESVVGGSLRAPWRWERLLVDASVIGGRERWARRLEGLEAELRMRLRELTDEDEARAASLERRLRDLVHLREFALPLVDRLASLPERATWGEWLEHLRELASAALQHPEGVLRTLGELNPMDKVGPVDLDEVQLVLTPHLSELPESRPRRRYGAVFVAPADSARGMSFDVVFVPGLAEKIFPRKIVEDPVLLDALRRELSVPTLTTQPDRVAAERMALRLAAGAAREHLYLSYPRVDVQQARPRVPSFYGLEALRAAEGRLPGFDELGARASSSAGGRLGWPAPEQPEEAIDEAEYDLALLAPLLDADPETTTGTASYLLTANVHLARALRARARRWLRRWTPADGLVDSDGMARQALSAHQLSERSFSPTALQHFAACPYRFYLQAIHRLQPREEAEAIEVIDPLTRGALFHEVQFAVLTRLRADGLLPVTNETLRPALEAVDAALDAVAAEYAERLAPAISRVWDDGINTVRADLREWLRRQAACREGWIPDRFELSFGLADRDRPDADPASVPDPVEIQGGLKLRGSIDLVERHPTGVFRATDHKTGKVRAADGVVVGGGAVLQPVLYALVGERLLGASVESGRLYYCTADGGYVERVVPLDGAARASAETVIAIIEHALREGFLPAAPSQGSCRFCDYRRVCGPYEEVRTLRKPRERLADLDRLRGLS